MKTDENWRETRLLSEDIDKLLGLPVQTTESLLKIIENLLVHKYLEEVLRSGSSAVSISLPYLGSLVVEASDNGSLSTNFVVRRSFYNKLKKAYVDKSSPLVEQCSDLLGKDLVRRFEEGDIT